MVPLPDISIVPQEKRNVLSSSTLLVGLPSTSMRVQFFRMIGIP